MRSLALLTLTRKIFTFGYDKILIKKFITQCLNITKKVSHFSYWDYSVPTKFILLTKIRIMLYSLIWVKNAKLVHKIENETFFATFKYCVLLTYVTVSGRASSIWLILTCEDPWRLPFCLIVVCAFRFNSWDLGSFTTRCKLYRQQHERNSATKLCLKLLDMNP